MKSNGQLIESDLRQKLFIQEVCPHWKQVKHKTNETLLRLAWSSLDGLCNLSGLSGACWQRVIGKKRISLVEIADLHACSEDRVRLICSDVVRQLLVMGFRPVKTEVPFDE